MNPLTSRGAKLLDSLTPESVFAQILMEEPRPVAHLLVEGPDESAILYGFTAPGVSLVVSGGKRNVIGAAAIAEQASVSRVYGLVDNDYDGLRGGESTIPRSVLRTEAYDLVADVVAAAPHSIRRVASAHAAPAVSRIEAETSLSIDEVVFLLSLALGASRLAALREGYPLIFKSFDFGKILAASFHPIGHEAIISSLKAKDPTFRCGPEVLEAVRRAERDLGGDRRRVGGHDLVGAVVAVLRQAGAHNVSRPAIEGSLVSLANAHILNSLRCLNKLRELAKADSIGHLFLAA